MAGLGLPDRDYYTATDQRAKKLRTSYAAHVARMLQLAGDGGPADGTQDGCRVW